MGVMSVFVGVFIKTGLCNFATCLLVVVSVVVSPLLQREVPLMRVGFGWTETCFSEDGL